MKNRAIVLVLWLYALTALYSLLYLIFPIEEKDLASFAITARYISGGNDLSVGLTGAAGMMTLIVVNAGIIVYDRYFSKENLTV